MSIIIIGHPSVNITFKGTDKPTPSDPLMQRGECPIYNGTL